MPCTFCLQTEGQLREASHEEYLVEDSSFVVYGRRIVDVELLGVRLARGCYSCKTDLRLVDINSENRHGLASTLSSQNRSCPVFIMVQTSKSAPVVRGKRQTFSVNAKAALGE